MSEFKPAKDLKDRILVIEVFDNKMVDGDYLDTLDLFADQIKNTIREADNHVVPIVCVGKVIRRIKTAEDIEKEL